MELILFLFLALLAVIAIKFVGFLVTCVAIGFKVGLVVLVGAIIWKCVKTFLKA